MEVLVVVKNGKSKKKLNFVFLLALALLILPFTSAVTITSGTYLQTSGTNYNLSFPNTGYLHYLEINSTTIIINPINLTLTNENTTNDSQIYLFNLTNALIQYTNGTSYQNRDYRTNDGNLTIIFEANDSIYIQNNYADNYAVSTSCTLIQEGFQTFADFIIIIVLTIVIIIVVSLVEQRSISRLELLTTGVLTIVFVGIILIMGSILTAGICAV